MRFEERTENRCRCFRRRRFDGITFCRWSWPNIFIYPWRWFMSNHGLGSKAADGDQSYIGTGMQGTENPVLQLSRGSETLRAKERGMSGGGGRTLLPVLSGFEKVRKGNFQRIAVAPSAGGCPAEKRCCSICSGDRPAGLSGFRRSGM